MKINKLFNIIIVLIIIIINNIANCQIKCPEPYYFFEDSHCDSDFRYILKPTIFLNNFYQYTNISCSPKPISAFVNSGVYKINLDNNINYTCRLTNPSCSEDQIIQVSTSLGPQLLITHPKCINSLATIDFITGDGIDKSNYQYFINNQLVTLPYETLFENLSNNTNENSFSSMNDGTYKCSTKFYLNQATQSFNPELIISHATCNKGGRISITNHKIYTSINLFNNETSSPLIASGIGIFDNLVSGDYIIILESNICGKQKFRITIENIAPTYQVKLINDICPLKPQYQLLLDNKYTYNLSSNGIKLNNPFKISGISNIKLNIQSCGIYNIPINSKIYSIPPIHYTISDTNDFCNGKYSVKLLYNSTLVPNLKGSIKSTNTNLTLPLDFKDDSSFEIVYNNQKNIYQLTSECYSEPIEIVAPSRKPHYEISKTLTNYCNELVDIKIINYLDFTTLKLYSSSSGTTYQHTNGIFKNVPNQLYDIQFIYRNCSNELDSIKIGNNKFANINFTSNIIQYPSCGDTQKPGLVTFTIYDKFTNDKIMVTPPQQFYYNNNNSMSYSISLDMYSNCTANIIFNYTYHKPEYKINIIEKPTCKYSNDGIIQINSNDSAITQIYINDKAYKFGLYYNVTSGINLIEIVFSSPCIEDIKFLNIDPKYPDFDVLYDTTPVISCDNSSGSITIKDYEKYNKLTWDDQKLINGSTGNTQRSGNYKLDFSIQLGSDSSDTCIGSKQIFIPTSIETDIKYRVITQPLCNHGTGSVIIDSLIDKDGKEYNIDFVNDNEGDPYIQSIYSNNFTIIGNTVSITSGSCSWNKEIDMEQNIFNISAELDGYYVQDCVGYTRYKIIPNGLYSPFKTSDNGLIFDYYTVNSIDGDKTIYILDSSDICGIQLTFKAIKPSIPNIKYNITINGDTSCLSSFTTINIQVENYQNYKYLKYNDIPIDSNGYFLNVKQGGAIIGELLDLDCEIIEQIYLNDSLVDISKSVTNETCFESLDGEIQISSNNDNNYFYLIQNYLYGSYYSLKSNSSDATFQLLGSQDLKIIKMNKLNPTCIQYQLFQMDTDEPEIQYDNEVCPNDNSINYNINKQDLNGEYNIYPFNSSSNTTSSLSIKNLSSGNNYTISFLINSDHCKRKLETSISIDIKDCNNNLNLKIGLPIGLFFFLLFATIAGMVIYKKRTQFAKAKDIDPISHDYDSVKIYTGNKVQEIDKF